MKKRDFIRTSGMLALGTLIVPTSCTNPAGAKEKEDKKNERDVTDKSGEGPFKLPELGYEYEALEPVIDKKTMKIHYGKHHAGYVRKLNKAIENHAMSGQTLAEIIAAVSAEDTNVRNNGGGHYNHSLFWEVMAPGGTKVPEGNLRDAMKSTFGSFDGFKEEFSNAAASQFGSGWAWLSVDAEGKLFVSSTPNQDNPAMTNIVEKNGTPILGLDVWEHAYYLQYQNKRKEYIDNFFKVINWEEVASRMANLG